MIRLFMVAMLLSASIHSENFQYSATSYLKNFKKNCKECKRGHAGPQGPRGQDGANGPTGPTGPAGLSTPNIVVPYTTASTQIISSITPPFLGRVHLVPFGGSPAGRQLFSNGPSGPELVLLPIQHYAYNMPQDKTIASIAATFTFSDFVDTPPPPGTELTARVEIWVASNHSNIFTPSGAGVSFPTLVVPEVPSDLDHTVQSAGPVALNVLIPAGSRILMVCSMTCAEPIRIRSMCTVGITMK